MFLVLLKIKNKIHFESLDTQEDMIDFIESVEGKFGEIEYMKSIIVKGSEDDISELTNMIEEHYYLHIVGRKIDEKVYKELIALLNDLNLDVKITYGIEFEDADVEEEDEDAPPNIGTLLNTDSLKEIISQPVEEPEDTQQLYSFYVYWFDDRVIFTLDEMDGFDSSKSFKQSYENLDEVMSVFEGFKHDFMEISENETVSSFEVTSQLDVVGEFIEQKLTLMGWKDTKPIKYLNGRYKQKKVVPVIVEEYSNQDYLTAKEVMRKLRISDQTLANWRRSELIEFKKISNRKYLYMVDSVNKIFENGVDTSGIANIPENKPAFVPQSKPKTIDYKAEIIALLKPIAFKIPEYKYQKQNFFLNFGNVGIASSPQVMISDDFQLVDFIKKTVLKETPAELYEYLVEIRNDGKEPRIDTSKKIQTGFSKFYLNKLFDKEMVSS